MIDRELLELAAKATGDFYQNPINRIPDEYPVLFYLDGKLWNPLTDDGDALRLAVKLGIWINTAALEVGYRLDGILYTLPIVLTDSGLDAATRRAIVRAAAEIGKAMEPGKKET